MNNPTRRNKNIGTDKQGYKTQSKFKIPSSWYDSKYFYEKLTKTNKIVKKINSQEIIFIVEKTKKGNCHACTIEDIERILKRIPIEYYEGLTTFIMRQPKAKETIFSPVWGRLIYLYERGKKTSPAVILEAVDYSKDLIWERKLSLDSQKEISRLRQDGYEIEEDSRKFRIKLSIENVRNTQLYRTLLHEIGHYHHYITTDFEKYETISTSEKEVFANTFADKMRHELEEQKIIPFDRIFSSEDIEKSGLNLSDFQLL